MSEPRHGARYLSAKVLTLPISIFYLFAVMNLTLQAWSCVYKMLHLLYLYLKMEQLILQVWNMFTRSSFYLFAVVHVYIYSSCTSATQQNRNYVRNLQNQVLVSLHGDQS